MKLTNCIVIPFFTIKLQFVNSIFIKLVRIFNIKHVLTEQFAQICTLHLSMWQVNVFKICLDKNKPKGTKKTMCPEGIRAFIQSQTRYNQFILNRSQYTTNIYHILTSLSNLYLTMMISLILIS